MATPHSTFPLPPFEYLRERFDYDQATGAFTWRPKAPDSHQARIFNAKYAGKAAGCQSKHPSGYRPFLIHLDGRLYKGARLIWKWMTGEDPDVIDHIDGDPLNNRWDNLRSISKADNARNRRIAPKHTGTPMGVNLVYVAKKKGERWGASYVKDGQPIYVGTFDTPEEAEAALRAARLADGFHPNHGREI
mgnify:CR=1 FL=1